MGRAPLGAAARSQVGSVRLNQTETAVLIKKYGSVTKALRALVNKELQEELEK